MNSAFECGVLVGLTEAHRRFRDEYGALTRLGAPYTNDEVAWAVIPADHSARQRAAEDVRRVLTLVAVDVEMIERRRDGRRFPIRAGIVARVFDAECSARGNRVVLFDGYIDPGAHLGWWRDDTLAAFDFKTPVHGIEREQLIAMRCGGELHALANVQSLLRAACAGSSEVDTKALGTTRRPETDAALAALGGTTCLVGHKLSADLLALGVCGVGLRRRIVDTAMALAGADLATGGGKAKVARRSSASKRAPSLRALVARFLPKARAAAFQRGAHAPLEDAEASLDVVCAQLSRCSADGVGDGADTVLY